MAKRKHKTKKKKCTSCIAKYVHVKSYKGRRYKKAKK